MLVINVKMGFIWSPIQAVILVFVNLVIQPALHVQEPPKHAHLAPTVTLWRVQSVFLQTESCLNL